MQLLTQLSDFKNKGDPIVLTIGNFDGVHRGHLAVLNKIRSLAGITGKTVLLTFSNHPSKILRPEKNLQLICTPLHKIKLIEAQNVHTVIAIDFTAELANQSAASFIEKIYQSLPFSHLVLGHDATIGKDRQGDRATLKQLGAQWNFEVHYLAEFCVEHLPVSSTRIRNLLQLGNLQQIELLLNRPYSIYGPVLQGTGKGKKIGFPTANLDVSDLCLLPFGVYGVRVKHGPRLISGIANLGVAPTIKSTHKPTLEVHLFDLEENLYGENLEVIFEKFIRPERKFNTIEDLQEQILKDIQTSKHI